MLAADELTDIEIADQLGVARSTLGKWKQHPDFEAKRLEHVAACAQRARSRGLGRIDKRMAAYEDEYNRLLLLRAERADDLADVPGGASGLIVRQYKSIGTGPNARQVEEYPFDSALDKAIKDTLKQAAQDAGQWSERVEHTGDLGAVLIREIRVPAADPDEDRAS